MKVIENLHEIATSSVVIVQSASFTELPKNVTKIENS
jgi:hypothetical protein